MRYGNCTTLLSQRNRSAFRNKGAVRPLKSPAIDYEQEWGRGPAWLRSRPEPCRSCVYSSPSTACTWCTPRRALQIGGCRA
jgi:hypothetical protein